MVGLVACKACSTLRCISILQSLHWEFEILPPPPEHLNILSAGENLGCALLWPSALIRKFKDLENVLIYSIVHKIFLQLYLCFSGAEVRVCCGAELRGDTRHDLHLPPRHVRPLRDRDPRQHLLLHARLPDPQVSRETNCIQDKCWWELYGNWSFFW